MTQPNKRMILRANMARSSKFKGDFIAKFLIEFLRRIFYFLSQANTPTSSCKSLEIQFRDGIEYGRVPSTSNVCFCCLLWLVLDSVENINKFMATDLWLLRSKHQTSIVGLNSKIDYLYSQKLFIEFIELLRPRRYPKSGRKKRQRITCVSQSTSIYNLQFTFVQFRGKRFQNNDSQATVYPVRPINSNSSFGSISLV